MTKAHETTPSGKLRARGIGIAFDGTPGENNCITDFAGVMVGYHTLIEGDGPLVVGKGPVRTGVTAILPRPHGEVNRPVFAGFYSMNGNGELTGTHWIEESGQMQWPVTLTNTHSCGLARDATVKWAVKHFPDKANDWSLPVSGETYDGDLNDINGFHVQDEHVFAAIDDASSGPIEQGSLGGGTGMICYEFNAGSGSASREVEVNGSRHIVGVFVQANFGLRRDLIISGVPVGRSMPGGEMRTKAAGSVIAIVATDAPLMPHQLKRLCRRVPLGLARTGTTGNNGSGDIFLGFSTAGPDIDGKGFVNGSFLQNDHLDPIFAAVVQATEEAVIDSMIVNETMAGRDGITARAIDHGHLKALLGI
jgi:L-aminopeptidase/D-esterase-like protein